MRVPRRCLCPCVQAFSAEPGEEMVRPCRRSPSLRARHAWLRFKQHVSFNLYFYFIFGIPLFTVSRSCSSSILLLMLLCCCCHCSFFHCSISVSCLCSTLSKHFFLSWLFFCSVYIYILSMFEIENHFLSLLFSQFLVHVRHRKPFFLCHCSILVPSSIFDIGNPFFVSLVINFSLFFVSVLSMFQTDDLSSATGVLDTLCLFVFFMELCLRAGASSWWIGPSAVLRDSWALLDVYLVASHGVTTAATVRETL